MKARDLQKKIEDFYGIHSYIGGLVVPYVGIYPHRNYNFEEFNEKKKDKKPSELIQIVSSLTRENLDSSMLSYGQVRESYERWDKQTIMNLPIAGSWLALAGSIACSLIYPLVGIPLVIGSFYSTVKLSNKRVEKLKEYKKEFSEFEKLLNVSIKADKIFKEKIK